MDRTLFCLPGLAVLLAACILIAGCSSPENTPAPTTVPATTTLPGPKYTAGDIVKNPASSSSGAWLVLSYDSATDSYERALVYQNDDGSWGYRSDDRTETAKRTVMEKVYTDVVENKDPASVPVVTPTTIATTEITTRPTTVVATTTVSTNPKIQRVIPDYGDAGTTVRITDLVGSNFRTGINVTLSKGGVSAKATNVKVANQKSINCDLAIPASAAAGAYDITVTNLDGSTDTYSNLFTVHRSVVPAITTAATSGGSIPITSIEPSVGHIGYSEHALTGSGFQGTAEVYLQKSGKPDIKASTVIVQDSTHLRFFISIPVGSFGIWDLKVVNPDQSYGVRYEAYSIQ